LLNGYTYGFNGQEKDDEIANGIYTAPYWEYDSRLGRRWNLDPVVKASLSGYLCFSNNPIIYIDPDGSTDYYNKRGKWIGTDGIDNGEKQMALSKTTAKVIKQATKANMVISMNPNVYTDLVQVPNEGTKKVMNDTWKNTEKSGNESTIVVGKNSQGQENALVKEGTPTSSPTGATIEEFNNAGGTAEYAIHTHPLTVVKDANGDYNVSTPNPSNVDVKNAGIYESENAGFNSGNQSMVIGPQYSFDENAKAGDAPSSTIMVTFYNSKNTTPKNPDAPVGDNTPMKPNGSMKLNDYNKAVKKVNADYQKRRGKN
jgi:RHS repeat-associated protein